MSVIDGAIELQRMGFAQQTRALRDTTCKTAFKPSRAVDKTAVVKNDYRRVWVPTGIAAGTRVRAYGTRRLEVIVLGVDDAAGFLSLIRGIVGAQVMHLPIRRRTENKNNKNIWGAIRRERYPTKQETRLCPAAEMGKSGRYGSVAQ